MKLEQARRELENIKIKFKIGILSYDEAKEMAKPFLVILNNRAKQISKEHNVNFYEITFTGYMR